ncbi:MAG: hypothetical protein IT357_05105 [Gemmatimonadaceae bacterium]|nr:hypothetical protein [Gemmatimonadaceae bacterium]
MPSANTHSAGLMQYLKHGFLYRWNLLLFFGGAGLALLSPWPDAMIPILAGLELAYLTSLVAMPRFRQGVDAKVLSGARARVSASGSATTQDSLQRMVEGLPVAALKRFVSLRQRCAEMRAIATGVRGQAASSSDSAESIRTPALDRLLFLFLKLLISQNGLERFLRSTSEAELSLRVGDVKERLSAAQATQEERLVRSLADSLADADLRLENYRKSMRDAEFVAVELDRIETKIHALTEMGVSRQDPDALSHQVSAAAESMQQTELAVDELRHLTGLADHLQEPPAILEADLSKLLIRGR